jgi:Fe-S cluster biogenesis protein NfuA
MMDLREFVKNWIADGKDVLIQMPVPKEKKSDSKEAGTSKFFEPSEYDDAIRNLLDEYVRPAVENDGGAIEFLGYDNGVVTVSMQGSCAGCPSSTATLKGGIENLLKSHLPEVKEVVAA